MPKNLVLDIINRQYFAQDTTLYREYALKHVRCTHVYHSEAAVPRFSCKFSPLPSQQHLMLSSNEDGDVILYNTHSTSIVANERTHANAVFDVCWVPDEAKFLTLSGDNTVKLWDCQTNGIKMVAEFEGHEKSVRIADFKPNDSACFATGSRDGYVLLWDRRMRNAAQIFSPEQIIKNSVIKSKSQFSVNSVTGVAFQDEYRLLCCGSLNPMINVWDLRRTYFCGKELPKKRMASPWNVFEVPNTNYGFSCLTLNSNKTRAYAMCMNSNIYSFNLGSETAAPVSTYTGLDNNSFYVRACVSTDGDYLVSGSSDGKICIWLLKKSELLEEPVEPIKKLEGHWEEVTGVDFHKGGSLQIASCGDDGTVRLWKPIPHAVNLNKDELSAKVLDLNLNEPREKQSKLNFHSPKTLFVSLKRRNGLTTPPLSYEKRLVLSPIKDDRYSPTCNLPNYVLDGTGPSHNCAEFRQKENVDWLTRMRLKRCREEGEEDATKRMKRSRNGKPHKTRRTLFDYYKKAGKPNEEVTSK